MGDREVLIRLRADISQYSRDMKIAAAETQAFGRAADSTRGPLGNMEQQSKRSGNEIDKLSGRLRLLADSALILGPALVPLGAGAIGGIVALSAELGSMAGALGVTLLAVHGLGDGLKALDNYQLNPTAENLAKVQQQMEKLGPSGAHFVQFLDHLEPTLKSLQFVARDGLFPGAEDGIDSLLQRLPELKSLIAGFATELGALSRDAGAALGGDGFDKFFAYLKTDGVKLLDEASRTIGNLAESVANLFVGFGGVSSDFSGGLLKFSQGLERASENLDTNQGFQDFLDYIRTEGPHALETIASIADALLQIVEAAAPLGGPVLSAVKAFADALASIADSNLGTPIFTALAALALYNRSLRLTAVLNKTAWGGAAIGSMKAFKAELTTVTTAQDRARMSAQELDAANARTATAWKGGVSTLGKGAALIGALTIAQSDYVQQTGLSNTASLGLAGTMAGPLGGALGTVIGFTLDLKHANDDLNDSLKAMDLAKSSGDIDAYSASVDKAAQSFNDLNKSPGWQSMFTLGGPFKEVKWDITQQINSLTGKTDEAGAAIEAASKDVAGLKDGSLAAFNPVSALSGAITQTVGAAQAEANALQEATDAMQKHRQEALRGVNAALDYQQAIDDAKKALKDNGKTADETTNKGRDNLRALYQLASAWNAQSNAAKNAKGSLEDARHNFIDTAEAMGVGADKAHQLANRLFEIPPKRKTQIELDGADEAINKVKTLSDYIRNLHGKSIDIALNYERHGSKPSAPIPGTSSADGSTVPKTGRGYADRHLYLLADGEEVISNRRGQADRHRPLLKAINAGRMADGGTSGGHHSRSFTFITSEAGAEVIDSAHGLAQALKMLQAALAKSEKSLTKERTARDAAQQAYDSFSSSVGSAYSTKDPFAAADSTGGVWSAGGTMGNPLASFDSALASNTSNTQAAQAALAQAAGNGLDGPLYAALAQSGNLQLLQSFAGLSSQQIDQREQAFAAQSNAQSALGASAAATAGLTKQLADANAELTSIRDEVKGLRRDVKVADANNQIAQKQNAKDVKDGVNGAAASGHKKGR